MKFFKRLSRSILKRLPGGRELLRKKNIQKKLFNPASESIFLLSGKNTDAFYRPAFERIFLLLKAFGLRGDIYEFGVFRGYTSRLFAEYASRFELDAHLHLFDSFEGLPEFSHEDQKTYESKKGDWKKGSMGVPLDLEKELQKNLQTILGKDRIHVIKGFYEETLERYFQKNRKKAAIVHVDCDLYSSSRHVFSKLFEYNLIQDGTIVICDDWMCSLGNPNLGQRKALADTLEENPGWQFEPYLNYGFGSQVFVVHDLKISEGKKTDHHENASCCSR